MVEELKEVNYWLVRTFSGRYFTEFVADSYIAIGWNEIADLDLIKTAPKNKDSLGILMNLSIGILKKEGKDESQPGRITNPIMRFCNEMAIDDIVIIPNEDSRLIQFGVIKSEVYLADKKPFEFNEGECNYLKRRKVNWVTWRDRHTLDPYLFSLLNSHYAVTKANDDYAHYIDRTLHGFFVKGGKAYLILEVKKETGIYGNELLNFISQILRTVDLVNTVANEELNKNKVEIKLNIQSPGIIELSGDIKLIGAIAVGILSIIGGTVKIKDFEVSTPGLGEMVLRFVHESNNHKIELRKLEMQETFLNLQVRLPKELTDSTEEETEL